MEGIAHSDRRFHAPFFSCKDFRLHPAVFRHQLTIFIYLLYHKFIEIRNNNEVCLISRCNGTYIPKPEILSRMKGGHHDRMNRISPKANGLFNDIV